jgi:hypothetical protein
VGSEVGERLACDDSRFRHRLLADAKYLHQKLSVLKNVGAPSAMLETVVAEKGFERGTHGEQPSGETKPASTRMTKSPVTDKALPGPAPIPDPPSPGSTPPVPNGMGRKNDINGRVTARLSSLMSSRPIPSTPSPRGGGAEVEVKSPPGKLSKNTLPPDSVPASATMAGSQGSHQSQFEGREAGYSQPPRNAQLPDAAVVGDIVRPTSPMKLPVMEDLVESRNEPPAS